MIYFTSDLHFFHTKIMRHCGRPFNDAEEMNKAIIKNYNKRVNYDDDVYFLGDITMKGPDYANEIISQLGGRKHLIIGNHDKFVKHESFEKSLFVSISDYEEIEYKNLFFIMSHYPFLEWNGYFRGSVHLHGHQHNKPEYNLKNKNDGIRRYDVGVDANGMKPISIDEICSFFEI